MDPIFSDRITDVPRSFIREILKATSDESIISFAGGLPNRKLFPVAGIRKAVLSILDHDAGDVLQYSTTEGYPKLRQWIAERYKKNLGVSIAPEQILITSGSQQGLDLLGKVLLNDHEHVGIEEPGYLGAIQAFSLYRPHFHTVPMEWDGINLSEFEKTIRQQRVKLFYAVPNFQNPSGISYSTEKRTGAAEILKGSSTLFVEDDPYGELRFLGTRKPSFYELVPENTILLGSFSKIFAPSFRIGWLVASGPLMEKLVIAKQATDLHTNYFGQRLLHEYLLENDIDSHIRLICEAYGRQRAAMVRAIRENFPDSVTFSEPEGGMFLWVQLPEGMSALKLFEKALARKVAFVPGDPFYIGKQHTNTLRLNFSCLDEESIARGIHILGQLLKEEMSR
jgi:2-aminoadipate transaminase